MLGVRERLEQCETAMTGTRICPWMGRLITAHGHFDLDFDGARALLATVETQARPHAWRRMIAAFDRGEPFEFGAVVADVDGLRVGTERMRWAQVQLMTEEGHRLRVHTDLGDTVIDRFAVSFRTVLATLLEEVSTHAGDVRAIARTLPRPPPPAPARGDLPVARRIT